MRTNVCSLLTQTAKQALCLLLLFLCYSVTVSLCLPPFLANPVPFSEKESDVTFPSPGKEPASSEVVTEYSLISPSEPAVPKRWPSGSNWPHVSSVVC